MNCSKEFEYQSSKIKCICMLPLTGSFACGTSDGELLIWNDSINKIVAEQSCDPVHKVKLFEGVIRAIDYCEYIDFIYAGGDNGKIYIIDYQKGEIISTKNAHNDYIRSIKVHPKYPLLISCSDEMIIKLYAIDKYQLNHVYTYENHKDFIIDIAWNNLTYNLFASASMDATVKIWSLPDEAADKYMNNGLESISELDNSIYCEDERSTIITKPQYTLVGHTAGVNCIKWHMHKERQFLLTCSDDATAKIFDVQSRSCLRTLSDHDDNIIAIDCIPKLNLLYTICEDSCLRIYNMETYKEVYLYPTSLGRLWAAKNVGNFVVIGGDNGLEIVKIGSSEPCVALHNSGKLSITRGNEVLTINLNVLDLGKCKFTDSIAKLTNINYRNLGFLEFIPQSLCYSLNGRWLLAEGNDEYALTSAQSLKIRVYGRAANVCYSGNNYVILTRKMSNDLIAVKQENDEQLYEFTPELTSGNLYCNSDLIVVANSSKLAFYNTKTGVCITSLNVAGFISIKFSNTQNPGYFCIKTRKSLELWQYDNNNIQELCNQYGNTLYNMVIDQGIELLIKVYDFNRTELHNYCFIKDLIFCQTIYGKLLLLMPNLTYEVCHYFDGNVELPYLVGYWETESVVIFIDPNNELIICNINNTIIDLLITIREGKPLHQLSERIKQIKDTELETLAKLLYEKNYVEEAMQILNQAHTQLKFSFAINSGKTDVAYSILKEAHTQSKNLTLFDNSSWLSLGYAAINNIDFDLAIECFKHTKSYENLLSIAFSLNYHDLIEYIRNDIINENNIYNELHNNVKETISNLKNNVASIGKFTEMKYSQSYILFICIHLLQQSSLMINYLLLNQEIFYAALYARSYAPSMLNQILEYWSINADIPENIDKLIDVENIMNDEKFVLEQYNGLNELLYYDLADELQSMGVEAFKEAVFN